MLRLPAPAKLNLFLRITGRRADGYHNIQTLFQLLDYGDELEFKLRADNAIRVTTICANNLTQDGAVAPIDAQTNLVSRAARHLQQASGCALGADITLTKRLPIGGGLGGGSSDAATTLIGLNQLWGLGISIDMLADMGVALGADIPVFVRGRTAWAEGIGDKLEAIEMPNRWYLVLAPNCQVSTATIFNDQELTRNSPPITIRAFRGQGAENACQAVVEKRHPEVKKARLWLAGYAAAQMTGTGACVFASFEEETQAGVVLAEKPEHWQGFIARGINLSPVHSR